jgi:flagellar basal-body rod protein FlgB
MNMTNLIERALNIRSQYHRVISGNIANVDTPGYREKDVDFREELDRQIDSGLTTLTKGAVEIKEGSNDGLSSIDGNTVNMENQMVKLTENQLMFHALVQVTAKRFSMMKYLIREGR